MVFRKEFSCPLQVKVGSRLEIFIPDHFPPRFVFGFDGEVYQVDVLFLEQGGYFLQVGEFHEARGDVLPDLEADVSVAEIF